MITDNSFSPGFQTHHFKTTNVPGSLVTVVPLQEIPRPEDAEAVAIWRQELLDLVSREHEGTFKFGEQYKAGSYGGSSVVIYVIKVEDASS